MGIENLNRVHWILIGAFLGVALSWAWASTSENIDGMASVAPQDFERDVVQKDATGGRPLVFDVIIHPPEFSPQDNCNVNLVTYKRLAKDIKTGQYWWIDKFFVAKIPYTPAYKGRVQTANSNDMTIDTYLAELAKTNPQIKFSNGWWMQPKNAVMLGGAAGVVLIGGVWPTLLNLMTGAGFGKPPEPKSKKKEKALWNYKSTPTMPAKSAAVGAHQQAQLHAVADAYEQSVGPIAPESQDAATAVASQAQATAVQKLGGGPSEKVEPLKKPGDDDEIEVKGVFYPVLIHHQKKAEGKDEKPKG